MKIESKELSMGGGGSQMGGVGGWGKIWIFGVGTRKK